MMTAALTTTPHSCHLNNSKQHTYFNAHQWSQLISLQLSNAVGDQTDKPKFQTFIQVFSGCNLLTNLIPTCQINNTICIHALSIYMI